MTRDEKIKELLSEVREALYYPHDDSCCDCKNCKMIDKIDALLQQDDEQPEPATEYGICLCCGDPFSIDESVYIGTVHIRCWHRNKPKQPCERCGGLGMICKDDIGLAFGGVAAACPVCKGAEGD